MTNTHNGRDGYLLFTKIIAELDRLFWLFCECFWF